MNNSNSSDHSAAIREALLAGQKIAAIKLYREQTGASLAEAKDAVETLATHLQAGAEFVIPPKARALEPDEAIRAAIFAGRKIEAIKLYREQTKAGLAEAKAAVEEMEGQLRVAAPGLFATPANKGCLASLCFGTLAGWAFWKALA